MNGAIDQVAPRSDPRVAFDVRSTAGTEVPLATQLRDVLRRFVAQDSDGGPRDSET